MEDSSSSDVGLLLSGCLIEGDMSSMVSVVMVWIGSDGGGLLAMAHLCELRGLSLSLLRWVCKGALLVDVQGRGIGCRLPLVQPFILPMQTPNDGRSRDMYISLFMHGDCWVVKQITAKH